METDRVIEIIESHNFNKIELESIFDILLEKHLLTGGSNRKTIECFLRSQTSLSEISSDYIANFLHISNRTLYRRLKNENTHLGQLIDNEKKCRCLLLLQNNISNGTKISAALGFSEPAYFYKKFEKWVGVSFSEVKKLLAVDPSKLGSLFNVQ